MKILIVGPSWVGDMCMAQVLFTLLKHQYPDCIIDVLAPKWSEALLSRMPEVNSTLILPFKHGELALQERIAFGKSLRKSGYDWAITLPNSWKSAVVPFAAQIPRRTGWLGEARYFLLNDHKKLVKQDFPLMIQRFAALADFTAQVRPRESLPVPKLKMNEENANKILQSLGLSLEYQILALCPGAEYGATKIWPGSYYAKVADVFLEKGWQVWVLGSENDQGVASELEDSLLADNRSRFKSLVGKTQLKDAVDLLGYAGKVVANDSGLMHIASALGRPTVAVYGSTSPEFTPPLGEQTHTVQVEDLYCRPCFKRTCAEKHLLCLKDIEPGHVIELLDLDH